MNNYKRRRFETLGDKYSVCLLSLDDGKRMNDVDDVVAVVRVSIFDIAQPVPNLRRDVLSTWPNSRLCSASDPSSIRLTQSSVYSTQST